METQAVRDFVQLIEPVINFSTHTYGDMIFCPYTSNDSLVQFDIYAEMASEFIPEDFNRGYGSGESLLGYPLNGTTVDWMQAEGVFSFSPELGASFWEPQTNICPLVQEFFPTMLYLSWVAGDYACYHDYEVLNGDFIWENQSLDVMVRIKNRGLTSTSEEVSVELNPLHSAISMAQNQQSYGSIPARSFKDNANSPFEITCTSPVVVGDKIPVEIVVRQGTLETYRDTIYLIAGESFTLFEDVAEDGFTNWLNIGSSSWDTTSMDFVNGAASMTDTDYGQYKPSTSLELELVNAIDLTNAEHPFLLYNAKWSLEGPSDQVLLFAENINTGDVDPLVAPHMTVLLPEPSAYTFHKHWVEERIDLSAYKGKEIILRWYLISDQSIQSDGFYFDDLRVVDLKEPIAVAIPVRQNQSDIQLQISPNPSSGSFELSVNTNKQGYATLHLFDESGKHLLEKAIFLTEGNSTHSLNLNPDQKGVFFLELIQDGQRILRKIVKQ